MSFVITTELIICTNLKFYLFQCEYHITLKKSFDITILSYTSKSTINHPYKILFLIMLNNNFLYVISKIDIVSFEGESCGSDNKCLITRFFIFS